MICAISRSVKLMLDVYLFKLENINNRKAQYIFNMIKETKLYDDKDCMIKDEQ